METKPEEEKKPRRRAKKGKGHAGHHGGAWKVAYADFVTAMMALFLVLWLVSQADVKVKQAIASYFRSPGVFDTMRGGILSQAKKVSKEPGKLTSKDDQQVLYAAAKALKSKMDSSKKLNGYKDQVKIDVTEEGLHIQIVDKADQISFPSGSAALTPAAEEILKEIAAVICELPNKINIGGHTDSYIFPSNNGYTNWELSADRANAARRILQAGCVKPEQIHRIVGFADTQLAVPEDPFSPANRRISITVLRVSPLDEDAKLEEKIDEAVNKNIEKNVEEKISPKPEPAAKPKPETKLETKPETEKSPDKSVTTEKLEIENKLKTEGAVKVGEPDKVPSKPKTNN